MKYMRFICGLVALFTMPAAALQTAIGFEPDRYVSWNEGQPFEGRCVVRVRTTSQEQLDRVLDVAEDVWSERVGQGVLEIDIREADLHRLDAIGVPYDVLIEDLQAHADAHAADMMRVRREQLERKPEGFQRGGQVHDDEWFATYRTLDEITQYCENIWALRPDLATIHSIGQGLEGWLIFSITISAPDTVENPRDDRPVVYIFSTVHAREWIAPMTTSYFASKLVADYETDAGVRALLERVRVVIVPVGNPDGYLYSWSDERYWRKNRRDNDDGTFGVDINRNWGYEWGRSGSSEYTKSNTYRGTEPFSEPETRALRNAALGYGDKLIAHIDYHSYSQAVIWPFSFSRDAYPPEPAGSIFERIADDLVGEIEHVHGANYDTIAGPDFGTAAGSSDDWFYGGLGVTSFTIELRPRGSDFNPPVSEIFPCAQENYAGFLRYLQRVTTPFNVWSSYQPDPYVWNEPFVGFYATVTSGLEYAHPQTVQVRSRVGSSGDFDATPMTQLDGSDWYQSQVPVYPCGSDIEYYYEAIDDLGRSGTQPLAGGQDPFSTTLFQLIPSISDDMEVDTGWIVGHPDDTATAGIWERVDPVATAHQPGEDHTPNGTLCWVTDGRSGSSDDEHDVDGGSTSLITPKFAARPDEAIGIWFSFSTTGNWNDSHVLLYASNDDGVTWTEFGSLYRTNGGWSYFRFDFEPWVETSDEMRVRFVAHDSSDDGILEVAIDDIQIDRIGCPPSPADLNGDGELNFFDVSAFLVAYQSMDPIADFNTDGEWDFFDVSLFLEIFLDG